MCTGLIETIAWQAREWGVWIAVGHAVAREGNILNGATLFDPDGDRYMQHPAPVHANASPALDRAWTVRGTPLGVCALGTGRSLPAHPKIANTGEPVRLVIIPAALHETACDEDWLSGLAKNTGAYVCLALGVAAGHSQNGDSPASAVIMGPGGKQLFGEGAAGGIIHQELDVPPAQNLGLTEELGQVE